MHTLEPAQMANTSPSKKRQLKGINNAFAEFHSDSLHHLRQNTYDQIFHFPRTEVAKQQHLEGTIQRFVQDYRSLPLAARAKLENWEIKADEIRFAENPTLKTCASQIKEGLYGAIYRGIEVNVTCRTRRCSADSQDLHTEISALANLRHPNIIHFMGAAFSDNSCWIVTESLVGGSIDEHFLNLRKQIQHRCLAKADVVSWSLDLMRAINYMHQCDPPFIHGGLQPECLLLSSTGVLKVASFRHRSCPVRQSRLASPSHGERSDSEPSAATSPRSHPPDATASPSPYVAPELHGGSPCSRASDVYAAGGVLWYIRVHAARHPSDALLQQPQHPGQLGRRLGWPAFAGLVARARSEDPEARPSADALTRDLEGLEADLARRRDSARAACSVS